MSVEPVFYTGKGSLFPFPFPGKDCQFVFHNPNSKEKQETRVYLDTVRLIANYLRNAQAAVRAFETKVEKLSDDVATRAEKLSDDVASRSEVSEEAAAESGGAGDRIVLYSRLLNEYTVNSIKMKTVLQASVYEDRGYIFLKRYWYLQEPGVADKWLPCKGGFQFTLSDNAHDMLAFARECVDRYRKEDADADVPRVPAAKRVKLE